MSEFNSTDCSEELVAVKEEKKSTIIEAKLENEVESIQKPLEQCESTSMLEKGAEADITSKTELQLEHERVDTVATIGGSTTRRYLNEKVTRHLLEGMKLIAREKPDDPLRVLGEYLINASEQN